MRRCRTAIAAQSSRRKLGISISVVGRRSGARSGARCVAASRRHRCLDAAPARPAAEARRDHRHAHLVTHRLVDHGAEDHVRVRVGVARHDLGRLVDLEEAEARAAGDVEQDAGSAVERRLEQRRGDGRVRGVGRTRVARGAADAHQRRPGVAHDRAHVGEVEVDEARHRDQVGDALDALAEDVVGDAERLA